MKVIESLKIPDEFESILLMHDFPSLLNRSQNARQENDWNELEKISIEILQALFKGDVIPEESLKIVTKNYLSSIIGTAEFLTELSDESMKMYAVGLQKLEDFLKQKPIYHTMMDPIMNPARAIVLLALDPITANRNKIARYLRNIARPDVSIVICNQILEKTRLNYYSLTVLCGAYCDLGFYDHAIEAAHKALKFSPTEDRSYALNALVRAHSLKFKSNGDISEIELALEYGHQSIELKLDSYSANSFVAAAIASGKQTEIEFARNALSKAEPQLNEADLSVLLQAYQVAQAAAPTASIVEEVNEFYEDAWYGFDSLYELVFRDEGFRPTVKDVRHMNTRFESYGWFLQGLCDETCPECGTISLHSYRKHFTRYGKNMHYWALVCDECKTVTDSIDFDKKEFSIISTSLESIFPIADLCSKCDKRR